MQISNRKKIDFLFYHFSNLKSLEFDFNNKLSEKVKEYYSHHKQLGSKDRKFLNELLFNYYRYKLSIINNTKFSDFDIFLISFLISENVLKYSDTFAYFLEEFSDFFNSNEEFFEQKLRDFLDYLEKNNIESYPTLYSNQISLLNKELYKILNTKSPITIRTITQKEGIDNLTKSLKDKKLSHVINKWKTIDIFTEKSIQNLLGIDKYEIQDNGSFLISQFISSLDAYTILDACGGSGGKSLSIEYFNTNRSIDLYDINPLRLSQFKKRHHLVNTKIKTISEIDKNKKYDLILIDAPCTGSGTVRRNPDKKHTITKKIIDEFSKLQFEILNEYSKYCKPDGIIVYITCSLFDEENLQVVQKFLERNVNFKPLEIISQELDSYSIKITNFANILIPINYNGDIFFISTIKKIS